jgi:hypothetical protein
LNEGGFSVVFPETAYQPDEGGVFPRFARGFSAQPLQQTKEPWPAETSTTGGNPTRTGRKQVLAHLPEQGFIRIALRQGDSSPRCDQIANLDNFLMSMQSLLTAF